MEELSIELEASQSIYFASDFHLGSPNPTESLVREKKIIRWLDAIQEDAGAILLVGDIFDFWFEYRHVIPKGFARFQGQIARLRDMEIPIYFFQGNHDMWMTRYFQEEFGIPVYTDPIHLKIRETNMMVGHGDGLGPGDGRYKIIKSVFRNGLARWAFQWLHPNLGMRLAHSWSAQSRRQNTRNPDTFKEEDEWLFQFCKDMNNKSHFDYYVFGHRHLPLEMEVAKGVMYYNLGEWMSSFTYGQFDGNSFTLEKFEG